MEKELSAKDSRFKLGEEFKEDIQVKPDMSIQAKMKVKSHTGRTKREFRINIHLWIGEIPYFRHLILVWQPMEPDSVISIDYYY